MKTKIIIALFAILSLGANGYKAAGSMGANKYYGGEFLDRVKLIKKKTQK